MVVDTPNQELLLPEHHPQPELFVCDVADAVLKDDMASMEHPFYSLSKKPDTKIRKYQNGDRWVEIVPSVKGLATIYDKDILIFCISQIIAKLNTEQKVSRHVKIVARDLLTFINRTTGGKDYEALKDALARLDGTRIRTNIPTGGVEEHEGFGLIERYKIRRSQKTGRILDMEVTLSEWVFNAIREKEVLTLHRDYFRLRRPIDRRIYELARKHCGKSDSWRGSFTTLKNKSGSRSTMKEFRRLIRELAEGNHLPDYTVEIDGNNVVFRNRGTMLPPVPDTDFPRLQGDTYHDARIVAPGYDVHELEREWQAFWCDSGKPPLRSPDAAFVAFCKRRYERKPNP